MEHLLFGAFSLVVACDVAPGRCDSQHVGIISKQPSICQGYAFSLKVLSSLRLYPKERARKEKKNNKNKVQQQNCKGAGSMQIKRCVFRPDSVVVKCVCVRAHAVDIKGYTADLTSARVADEVMSGRGG